MSGSEGVEQELIDRAYRFASKEIVQTLAVLIDKENAGMGHIFITDKIQACWGEPLGDFLLHKARDTSLKPDSMGVLLQQLIGHEAQEAESFAKSLISLPLPAAGDDRAKAAVAATVLMRHAKNAGWSVVWPAINNDPGFSAEVIALVASREGWGDKGGIWQRINEDELADLFLWLARQSAPPRHTAPARRQYPPAGDRAQLCGTSAAWCTTSDLLNRGLSAWECTEGRKS